MFEFSAQSSLFCGTVIQPHVTALIANASVQTQQFPNTSSTSVSRFSFIIPYGQTQDCDIYGPACQTGSITVGVNFTTTITTTVLPCSSYLSAQFAYLWDEVDSPELGEGSWPALDGNPDVLEWNWKFGQSPQCKSYAKAMSQGQSTFSNCGSSNAAVQTDNLLQSIPGLDRFWHPDDYGTCCGNCSLDVAEVRLYFFPDKTTIDCYNNQTNNLTSTLSARNIEERVHSLIPSGSTAIFSGHTL